VSKTQGGSAFSIIAQTHPLEKGFRDAAALRSIALRSIAFLFLSILSLYGSYWSDTPWSAGLSPAAVHCAELRSFRRDWSRMALLACENKL